MYNQLPSSSSSSLLQNHQHQQLPPLQMHHQHQLHHHHHHPHQAAVSSTLNRQKYQQQQQQGHYPHQQQQQVKYGHQQQQQFHSTFESFLHLPISPPAAAISQQQPLSHHKHHHHSQMAPSRMISENDFRSGSNNQQSLLSLSESGDQDEQSSCGYGPMIENDDLDYNDDGDGDGGDNDDNERSNSHYNSSWIFREDFIINHTPSRRHGISYTDEIEYRRKGTKFIRDLTKLLKMKPICKETAYVYFHRFFMLRSFRQYDPIRIAMASLYFACKYEDHPLPKDHLIQVSYLLINNYVNKQQPSHKLNKDDKEYIEYCDRLILDENLMIQLLGFDNLRVTHFQVLVVESYSRNPIAGTTQELYTAAYQIASELNRLSTLCLEYTAPFLAAVSIYLAACYKTIRLPDDWCQTIITDMKNPVEMKKMVIQIGEKYREPLSSSQLIQKILSEEYLRLHRSPPGVMKKSSDQKSNSSTNDQQKQQHPALGALLMTNFSPDSAYSSSSSTAAAYSPAEQQQQHQQQQQPVNPTPTSNMSGDRKSQLQMNHSTAGGRNFRSMVNPISVGSQSQQQQQQTRYSMANNSNNNYQSNNMNQQQTNKKRSSTANALNNNNHVIMSNNNNGHISNFAQQQQQNIDFLNIQNNNNSLINRHNLLNQHYRSLISGNINNNNNNNQLSTRNLQQQMSSNKKFKSNHSMETTNSNEYYNRHNNNHAAYAIQQQLGLMFQHSNANGGGGVGGNNIPIKISSVLCV
nr:cyclin-T-like [Dermatophagoides farinae]